MDGGRTHPLRNERPRAAMPVRGTALLALAGAMSWVAAPPASALQTPVGAGVLAEAPPPAAPPFGLDLYRPALEELDASTAAVALGRSLFFEPRLSRDGSLSCAGCHQPERAFTDGRPVARGVYGSAGRRNVPTLVNRAYGTSHFLDGRARTLAELVLEPISNPAEMALPVDSAVARLAADPEYRRAFAEAFGEEVSAAPLARALAAFVASIYSGDAPVDRYMAGDTLALTTEARLGRRLFRGRAGCAACHTGPNHTDERFHNTGVGWLAGEAPADSGRFHVTGEAADIGAFRTPTLREVARTGPYMHDGSLATLDEVVAFYDAGGRPNPHLAREIRRLALSPAERRALVAYLEALTGTVRHP
jgi:cytochrome c peroxidase